MSTKAPSLAKKQMSKHITKFSKKPAGPLKKPIGNMRKIGEATAKRMQDKASKKPQKSRPKGYDEEIDSDQADDMEDEENEKKLNKQAKSIKDDPFFTGAEDVKDKNETLEERRLRMTKKLLEELQQPEHL